MQNDVYKLSPLQVKFGIFRGEKRVITEISHCGRFVRQLLQTTQHCMGQFRDKKWFIHRQQVKETTTYINVQIVLKP